jgi:hypothetical protein
MSYDEFCGLREQQARDNWTENRFQELLDILSGKRADVWLIAPNWYIAPPGVKCFLWDDFIAWSRDQHDDAVDVLGQALRNPMYRESLFRQYADERSRIDCAALTPSYFED